MKQTGSHDRAKSSAPGGWPGQTVQQTFIMTNHAGLHARPCALLDKTLRPFDCEVRVEHDRETADGRSLFGLMGLAVGHGSEVKFIISGRDARPAMAAVQRLFETRFEEAYAATSILPFVLGAKPT
jgi:phosphotransferase system HPr (HPr) family protein